MKVNKFIVRLENECYIAAWEGDPGRTIIKGHAKIFKSIESANKALAKARKYRPFVNATVVVI